MLEKNINYYLLKYITVPLFSFLQTFTLRGRQSKRYIVKKTTFKWSQIYLSFDFIDIFISILLLPIKGINKLKEDIRFFYYLNVFTFS